MNKSALTKDYLREIKNTFNRFASILLIVALGVAFFSGVRATKPDMWYSGDALYDSQNMMDIRLVSTLGLTKDDLEAIRQVEGVKDVQGVNTLEVLSEAKSNQNVIKLIAAPESVNMIKVTDGRLPEKNDEILIDTRLKGAGYKIGDIIYAKSGTSDALSDSINVEDFKIVGTGTLPYYLSLTRGTASIGTGSLTGFAIVCPEVFESDIYSEIQLTVDGAKDMMCYGDDYKDYIDGIVDRIKEIEQERCDIRYQDVVVSGREKIDDAQKEIDDALKKLEDAKKEIDSGQRELNKAKEEIAANEQKLSDGQKQLGDERVKLDEQHLSTKAALKDLQDKKSAVDAGLVQVTTNLKDAKNQLLALQNYGMPDTAPEVMTLKGVIAGLEEKEAELKGNQLAINQGIAAIEDGLAQIEAGYKIISEKESELESAKAQLEDGKNTLAKNESKLNDGKREYNENKKDADEEIADATKKLEDARNKLDDISKPEWYVLTRETLQTYVEYGQDAERIGNIGKVFPLIFFIVAALVALTTMTRMVEEQRMQIGTLKALGYSGWDVSKKFILYGLFASIIGSAIGVVVGQIVLPTVIIKAYAILYVNVKDLVIPLDAYYTITSSLAAIGCTVGATILACYKELRAVPAQLMRPVAPKNGKRILLDRMSFLWKRLSFSGKATARNLFRYKKRFFMTIFGVGGCMALILVGYGIKDSILCIGTKQYGEVCIYQSVITKNKHAEDEKIDELYKAIESDEDITAHMDMYEASIDACVGTNTKSGYIVVPSDKDRISDFIVLQDRLSKKRYSLDDEKVIISEKLSSLLGVKVGDTITLKDSDTSYNDVTVGAISENYFMHYIYMSPALYERIYGELPEFNTIYTRNTQNDEEYEKVFGKRYLDMEGVSGVTFISSTADNIANMLRSMDIIIYVLIISAGLLAFVVLYNLNNINITERRRELATIKVLGFYDMETAMYIYRENIWLTLFGIILGFGIGFFLHKFVILTAEVDLLMFARDIMPRSYLLSVLLTIVFTIIINGVMYFQLKKINMVESLKSVE